MSVAKLPDLDEVFAKWENRGRGQPMGSNIVNNAGRTLRHTLHEGRQKWKDKFGDNVRAPNHRRTRQKDRPKPATIHENQINVEAIAHFKTAPTILPESNVAARPRMGQCCTCLPMSKRDFVPSTSSQGLENILDLSKEIRKESALVKQFGHISFTLRRGPYKKYPDVSMATLSNRRLVEAVQQQAEDRLSELEKMGSSEVDTLQKKTEKNLLKMKSNPSSILVKLTGWFLFKFLGRILNSVQVQRSQIEMIQRAAERGLPMIYLPSHRSHLDYLLVTWILWISDIRAPYVAAGENLNMPFFRYLLGGLGGFFIRRKIDNGSVKRDKVYRSLLHSYIEELLRQGESIEFFVEGGRSRSGKACMPKGGLMSVVVDSCVTDLIEDAYIVPISINYEKLVDGNFNNEQMGLPKKKETFFGAIRAIWRVLNKHYGNLRVEIAQPFSLKEYIGTAQQNNGSVSGSSSTDVSPSEVLTRSMSSCSSLCGGDIVVEKHKEIIRNISRHVQHTSVHMTPLMCSNLMAFLFLTKHREGVSFKKLLADYSHLQEEIQVRKRDVGYSGNTEEVVQYALNILGSELISARDGEDNNNEKLYFANLSLPILFELSYYANSVIPVFLLESIVVNSVIYESEFVLSTIQTNSPRKSNQVSRECIIKTATQLCELLSQEFVFCAPCRNLEEELLESLDHLVTSEMLILEEQRLGTQYSMYDKQFAQRLSSSLSWEDDDDEDAEEYVRSEHFVQINVARPDCLEQLIFLHNVTAPILESYLITAYHIAETLDTETPEVDFVKMLHARAKERVVKQVATYGESAALDSLWNAVKSYQKLGIIDPFRVGDLNILSLSDHFEVKDKLFHYIQLLEALRD